MESGGIIYRHTAIPHSCIGTLPFTLLLLIVAIISLSRVIPPIKVFRLSFAKLSSNWLAQPSQHYLQFSRQTYPNQKRSEILGNKQYLLYNFSPFKTDGGNLPTYALKVVFHILLILIFLWIQKYFAFPKKLMAHKIKSDIFGQCVAQAPIRGTV